MADHRLPLAAVKCGHDSLVDFCASCDRRFMDSVRASIRRGLEHKLAIGGGVAWDDMFGMVHSA